MPNDRYISILEEIKRKGGQVDNGEPNDKVLIRDGLNTFIRVFSVLPTTNADGIHVGGIVGFLKSVGYSIKTLRPTRCIIVFDGKGGSHRRRKLFPEYKKRKRTSYRVNRVEQFSSQKDERHNMILQLKRCVEYLSLLPLTIFSTENIEADDVIAYITKQVLTESKITIMSTDKDFLQLVNERISIWNPVRKKLYNPEGVLKDYEIAPNNFLLYRVLDGDKSDNIPGIRGAGIKTIQKYFDSVMESENSNVKDLLVLAEQKKDEFKLYKNVYNNREQVLLNEKLMQLHNVNISASTKTKIVRQVNGPIQRMIKFKFQKMFMEDKLYSGLPNLNSWLMTTFNRLNRMAEKSHG